MNDGQIQPLSYFDEPLNLVMPRLQAGECCSLIGVSGVGKSNLARFLRRSDVQQHYWGQQQIWVLLIDAHGLIQSTAPDQFDVIELLLHRLITEAESRHLPSEFITWANDLHTRLVIQSNLRLALRYLERVLTKIIKVYDARIVIVFDQFESLWSRLEAGFFLNLRSLRDLFKYQLAYLLISRERLGRVRNDLKEVEAFCELFASHEWGIGLFSKAQAQVMLNLLCQRNQIPLRDDLRAFALDISGGHPGLLRVIFWELSQNPPAPPALDQLVQVPSINRECANIWHDLAHEEQLDVQRLIHAGGRADNTSRFDDLRLKSIVVGDPPQLFSGLFGKFASMVAIPPSVIIKLRQREVWVNGQQIKDQLPPLEFAMLVCLARHNGAIVPRDQIIKAIYNEAHLDTISSDSRINSLLKNLRRALGDDARNPRLLITKRGIGVRLVGGSVVE